MSSYVTSPRRDIFMNVSKNTQMQSLIDITFENNNITVKCII